MSVVEPWHRLEEDDTLPKKNPRLVRRRLRITHLLETKGPLRMKQGRSTLIQCSRVTAMQASLHEVPMAFYEEPQAYTKTAHSDLQGAWEHLRSEVAKLYPFPESERLLFHIDEAMSWESVRHLERMKNALLLIRNIIAQTHPSEEIAEGIQVVDLCFEEVLAEIAEGKPG